MVFINGQDWHGQWLINRIEATDRAPSSCGRTTTASRVIKENLEPLFISAKGLSFAGSPEGWVGSIARAQAWWIKKKLCTFTFARIAEVAKTKMATGS